jgi:hypothetical protein
MCCCHLVCWATLTTSMSVQCPRIELRLLCHVHPWIPMYYWSHFVHFDSCLGLIVISDTHVHVYHLLTQLYTYWQAILIQYNVDFHVFWQCMMSEFDSIQKKPLGIWTNLLELWLDLNKTVKHDFAENQKKTWRLLEITSISGGRLSLMYVCSEKIWPSIMQMPVNFKMMFAFWTTLKYL